MRIVRILFYPLLVSITPCSALEEISECWKNVVGTLLSFLLLKSYVSLCPYSCSQLVLHKVEPIDLLPRKSLRWSLVHFWKSRIWFFVYLRSSMSAEFENDIFPIPTEMKPASQINMCLIFFLTCQRWSISWLSKCHIMNTKTLFFLKYSSAWHLKIHRKRKSPMTEGEVKNFWQFFYFCSRHGNNMAFLDVTLWWTI